MSISGDHVARRATSFLAKYRRFYISIEAKRVVAIHPRDAFPRALTTRIDGIAAFASPIQKARTRGLAAVTTAPDDR